MKVKEKKPREEMKYLERKLDDVKTFLFNQVYYTVDKTIEVTVKRDGENFSYNIEYHKGKIPFEFSSGVAEELQKQGEEVLNNLKDKTEVTVTYTEGVSILKPYLHIKNLINTLK
jgi:hypothetical protein